ncbi:MAG: phosphopyruvate hydratase [Alphaproteobacteria bacterium]
MVETAIHRVIGRRVWDSRGRPTVEAEIHLAGGAVGRAIAPAGASTGSGEAVDLRDGGGAFGGLDVTRAVGAVNGEIAALLAGRDAADQAAVDSAMIACDGTPDKARLGGNALIAVSMAVAHAASAARGLPLWRHLAGETAVTDMPLPEIQVFGGGAHAAARVDLQDFMVVAVGASWIGEAFDWTAEVYRAAGGVMAARGAVAGVADEGGWWPSFDGNEAALEVLVLAIERAGLAPGRQVAIAVDVAATQFHRAGRYRLAADGAELDRDGWLERLLGWCRAYPIVSVEDPVAEDDTEGMAAFTAAAPAGTLVVADDFVTTDARRIAAAARAGAANTALIKPNQAGTLTETRAALRAARAAGWSAIVSARSGETEDTTVADLAVGWGADQLKVGSFARSERMAKWNACLRIDEALGGRLPLRRPARWRAG